MPLPLNNTAWPPVALDNILPKLREYDAWYSNQTDKLQAIYSGGGRSGFLGRLRKWFLGTKTEAQPDQNHIHVSLAQEICRTSANLVLAESPTVTLAADGDEKAQERLDLIAGPYFEQMLVAAMEVSPALGGVYFRANYDTNTRQHAFISKVDADMAWPEFRWGELVAVTFWRTVAEENHRVWRHLERHELDAQGNGVVFHGLYEGATDNLGRLVPLQDRLETENLAALVDEDARERTTPTPGLNAVYAPNIAPSALWRKDPIGAHLGRSDLEGIEQKLDALDELYSSWLRDIRLGKGRLIVGESMLRDLGAGLGTGFDLDTTIFTPVKSAPSSAGSEKMAIEQVQFEIRTDDFLKAIDHFRRIILAAAGYSASTFGMDDGGGAITATEVGARQQLSYTTRNRKLLGLVPALERILQKALAMDAVAFPSQGGKDLAVSVSFPDGLQDDAEAVARTNQLDYSSQSSSIQTRVQRAHPDWEKDDVDAEVTRIKEEFNLGEELPDPGDFGNNGHGLEAPPGEPVNAAS